MYSIANIIIVVLLCRFLVTCQKRPKDWASKEKQKEKPPSRAPASSSSSSSRRPRPQKQGSLSSRKKLADTPVQSRRAEVAKSLSSKKHLIPLKETQTQTRKAVETEGSKSIRGKHIKKAKPGLIDDDMEDDHRGKEKEPRRADKIQPKEQRELNRKELMIALGAKRVESAYPTMDDIDSDWGTEEEKKKANDAKGDDKDEDQKIDEKGSGEKKGSDETPRGKR